MELELANAMLAGEVLDLSNRRERTVRAEVIRSLLMGRWPDSVSARSPKVSDPKGLRLHGAVISGRIDLEHLRTTSRLQLTNTTIDKGISLSYACIPDIVLTGSTLSSTSLTALNASQATIEHDLCLQRVTINGSGPQSCIRLSKSYIGGDLDLTAASVINREGPSLVANGLTVGGNAYLEMIAIGNTSIGTVRLAKAHVGSHLVMDGATLTNANGPALFAEGLTVDGIARLAVTAVGSGEFGTIRLTMAHIVDHLNMDGADLLNKTGPALHADGLRVNGTVRLVLKARGNTELGTIRLLGAHVGIEVNLDDAVITNESGPAVYADGLTVDGTAHFALKNTTGSCELATVRLGGAYVGKELYMDNAELSNDYGGGLFADRLVVDGNVVLNIHFTGRSELGAVHLVGARIGSQLIMSASRLKNLTGPAINADGLIVGENAYLACKAFGNGEDGVVRLINADIGGQLDMEGAEVINSSNGPALVADGLSVKKSARLALIATGIGELGAVRLVGAHFGEQLDMIGAKLNNTLGPALVADGVNVDHDAFLHFSANGGGDIGVIRLPNATIGGYLNGDLADVHFSSPGWLVVDGLTYRGIPDAGVEPWLKLLRRATPSYAAQPYRQLAAACLAAGHEADTRAVLMSQRQDQLERASHRHRDRLWGTLIGWTLGYGYQPWRALLFLIGVSLAGAIFATLVGYHGLYPKDHEFDGRHCSVTERVLIGVDNAVPLITTNLPSSCLTRPSPNHSGAAINAVGIVTQTLGWAFATLFVAGFTNAVRKT